MNTYPIVRLGQTQQYVTPAGPSSFLTNPRAAIDTQILSIEDAVAAKLKDQNFRSMLIGGGIGLLAGLILYPIGQKLMGYTAVKESDLERQQLPAIGRRGR